LYQGSIYGADVIEVGPLSLFPWIRAKRKKETGERERERERDSSRFSGK